MKLLIVLLTLFFCSSLTKSIFCQQLPVLKLSEALEHPMDITLSDFIENISYVPLATTQECLVDINPKVLVTKDFILVNNVTRSLLFSRKTGAFIREIGKYGRGPGEYRNTFGFFNEITLSYYYIGWNGNLIKYSLDGAFRGNIKIPFYDSNPGSASFPDVYSFLEDSVLVCNFMIIYGDESKSMMIFTEQGKVIRILPNNYVLKTKQNMVIRTQEIRFHRFNNSLFFQSMYNDTVSNLTQDKISPSFILERGKFRPPFESRWWSSERKSKLTNIIYQPEYYEGKKYNSFYFHFNSVRYFALYDKSSKSLKITENKSGIKNDVDGFMDFSFNAINGDGELSCIIQPGELIKWIKQNPGKIKTLKPELQRLINIKPEDNPIIVIARYK